MNPDRVMHEITLPLDERNLAHVLTALALAGIADSLDPLHSDSRCSWVDDGFKLHLPRTKAELFAEAHDFVKSIAWVEGIGSNEKREIKASPHHGLFTAKGGHSGNPLLSYHDQGYYQIPVFKTFSKASKAPRPPLRTTTEDTRITDETGGLAVPARPRRHKLEVRLPRRQPCL